ncbi:MAG TPA: COX15/CtaA family protein [Acetobacteraceae bacterium]|nr:COX15/CtaA family protein [Acetobacteraceae bacterium]
MPFDLTAARPASQASNPRSRRLVAIWLFAVCGMILVMVALGGATRLTGSGLSIMTWEPLSGALPPLSHAQWEHLFALYKQIPQYKLLHRGFGLAGFQHIFWLEWVHRLWGRLIGVVFLLPLVWFWATGRIGRRLLPLLAAFFVLGGMQGAVGWIMVASGFRPDSVAVAPALLAAHLSLALLLYGVILWTGLSVLTPRPTAAGGGTARRFAIGATVLTALTIVAGSFVAGTHAGFVYNTFPLMDGRLVPASYAELHPFWRNPLRNLAAVQFDHRALATLTALAVGATVIAGLRGRLPRPARLAMMALGLAVAAQYALGVATLLLVVPMGLAVLHQCNAVLLLTAELVVVHTLRPARAAAPATMPAPQEA